MAKTVLAIDDSQAIRDLVSFVLGGAGFEVRVAGDGEEGMDWLREARPDVIITDINMPRLDGFGVIERARADQRLRGTPILVLTTEDDPAKKTRAKNLGATGWITKPFNPEQLLGAVRRVSQ